MRLPLLAAALVVLPFAGSARAEPRIELDVATPWLTLGQDGDARVAITVSGVGPGPVAPPRLHASVGTLELVARDGDHGFLARYRPPTTRFPQIAILAAEELGGPGWPPRPLARGFLALPLAAAATPSFRTDPAGVVTVDVGGRRFGPVRAGADGQARVPIVVLPGLDVARVQSTNATGQVSERELALHPPRFPRMLVLAPPALPADGLVELGVVAVAADGTPLDDRRVLLQSSYARPQPLGAQNGVARFLVRVPKAGADAVQLTARLLGEAGEIVESDERLVPVAAAVAPAPAPRNGLEQGADRGTPLALATRAAPAPSAALGMQALAAAVGATWAAGPGYGVAARCEGESAVRALPAPLRLGIGLAYVGMRAVLLDGVRHSRLAVDRAFVLARAAWRWPLPARAEARVGAGVGAAYTRVASDIDGLRVAAGDVGPAADLALELAGPAGPGLALLSARFVTSRVDRVGGDRLDGSSSLVFDLGYRVRFW